MGNYVSADDFKGEGLPADTDPELLDRRIEKWEALVETLTRNVFRVIEPGPLVFDGNNATILHFNLPIVSVSSLKINGDSAALDASSYRAHTGRQRPKDDRRNPKIELLDVYSTSIFTRSTRCFMKGHDQVVTAKWGFVDDGPIVNNVQTYVTPRPVIDAIIQLVIRDIKTYYATQALGEQAGGGGGAVVSETTDGHSISYAAPATPAPTWATVPNDIREVLLAYRAPIRVAAIDPSDSNKVPMYTWSWSAW